MTTVATAFRDADQDLTEALVRCLDFMNGLPAFHSYKSQTYQSLAIEAGAAVLDVACGVGFDAGEMAKAFPKARFVGVDKSRLFLDLARARNARLANLSFVAGDAARLPFADSSFDGARIDRSLQHIADPAAACAEMVRVVRPGGRIVAAEPDWGAFILYNGVEPATRKMTAHWLSALAHPLIGRELGGLFETCGLTDIGCRVHPLSVGSFETAEIMFDLTRLARDCVNGGILTAEEAADWRAASLLAAASGAFLAFAPIIERWGTVTKRL